MHLNLRDLQKIVKRVNREEKAFESLRLEVKRVLGPIMDTDVQLENLAEEVNYRVGVLTRTGRTTHFGFKPSTLIPFMENSNHEVRAMAANLLPPRFLEKMKFDPHSAVRAVVASRLEMPVVREMMKRFPKDDALRTIYRARNKLLREEGIPQPKVVDEPFDMYGEKRLGDAVKQPKGPELSDAWYDMTAFKILQDYGNNIECSWEEKAVSNFVRAKRATQLIDIDGEKLLKAVKKMLTDRDDLTLERDALKESINNVSLRSLLIEGFGDDENETFDESVDPVQALIESQLSPSDYIEQANKLFNIRESTLPNSIKKHRHGVNALVGESKVPVKAKLPHNNAPRALDEQALDLYVKHWTTRQKFEAEPLKLQWSVHPESINLISFNVNESFGNESPVEQCPNCSSRCKAKGRSSDGFGYRFFCDVCDQGWET
jgi:hypothetical protein